MSYLYEAVGYLAGICSATCFLPQTLKTIKSKEVKDLSLISYIIYCIGLSCWIIYGIYLDSLPMMIFNGIGIFFGLIILYMIIKYKDV